MIEIWDRVNRTIKTNPEGFTLNPRSNRIIQPASGYAVATNPFDVKNFIDFDSNEHLFIGYWEGEIDVVVIVDNLDEAMAIGRYYRQKYIYDFKHSKDIKVTPKIEES